MTKDDAQLPDRQPERLRLLVGEIALEATRLEQFLAGAIAWLANDEELAYGSVDDQVGDARRLVREQGKEGGPLDQWLTDTKTALNRRGDLVHSLYQTTVKEGLVRQHLRSDATEAITYEAMAILARNLRTLNAGAALLMTTAMAAIVHKAAHSDVEPLAATRKRRVTYGSPVECWEEPVSLDREIWPCPDCLPWRIDFYESSEDGLLVRHWHAIDCPELADMAPTVGDHD